MSTYIKISDMTRSNVNFIEEIINKPFHWSLIVIIQSYPCFIYVIVNHSPSNIRVRSFCMAHSQPIMNDFPGVAVRLLMYVFVIMTDQDDLIICIHCCQLQAS